MPLLVPDCTIAQALGTCFLTDEPELTRVQDLDFAQLGDAQEPLIPARRITERAFRERRFAMTSSNDPVVKIE
jgi:hypothetical protein